MPDSIITPEPQQIILPENIGAVPREVEIFRAPVEFDASLYSIDPETFAIKVDADNPERFEFVATIVTGELVPDRFCFFDSDTTMVNFAEDAKRGVSLLQSHSYRDLGIGYTFAGEHIKSRKVVNAGAYIVTNVGLRGDYAYETTNDFIRMLLQGAFRDVSVGIFGGTSICSICDGNIWSYRDCRHWPGEYYEIGKDKVRTLCTYTIYDAYLSELSFVSDGAVPGAMILKAQEMHYNREIDEQQIAKVIIERYPKFNVTQEVFHNKVYAFPKDGIFQTNPSDGGNGSGAEVPTSTSTAKEQPTMDFSTVHAELQKQYPALTIPSDPAECAKFFADQYGTQVQLNEASKTQIEQLNTQHSTLTESKDQEIATLTERNVNLAKQAKDGEDYRAYWLEQAGENHIKAYGRPMTESHVTLFNNPNTPASEIRKAAEEWLGDFTDAETSGGQQIHAGGQKTRSAGGEQGAVHIVVPRART